MSTPAVTEENSNNSTANTTDAETTQGNKVKFFILDPTRPLWTVDHLNPLSIVIQPNHGPPDHRTLKQPHPLTSPPDHGPPDPPLPSEQNDRHL